MSRLQKDNHLDQGFYQDLCALLNKKLLKVADRREECDTLMHELNLEFLYFRKAVLELMKGEKEQSVLTLFGRSKKMSSLHPKVATAIRNTK